MADFDNKNNIPKKDWPFYKRLTGLFRSGVQIRNKITGQDNKSFYDKSIVQTNLGYYGGTAYKRESSPFSVMGAAGDIDRVARYSEYVEMQYQPEVNTALDVYADETCSGDEKGRALHVFSNNPVIKRTLEDLFFGTMNVEADMRRWVRNLCAFGDFFLYLEVAPEVGVFHVEPILVSNIRREQFFDPEDPYAVRFKLIQSNKILENWQIAHFRIINSDIFLPYGTSLLESVRRTWRVLCVKHGEQVWTTSGTKEIQDLIPGDEIYSFNKENNQLEKTKVKNIVCNGNKKTYKVKTLHREISLTDNHPVLVWNMKNNSYSYKEVNELNTKNDYLVLPNITNGKKSFFIQPNYNHISVKLKNKLNYDKAGVIQRIKKLNLDSSIKNTHAFLQGNKKIKHSDFLSLQEEFKIDDSMYDYYSYNSYKKSIYDTIKGFEINKEFARLFGFLYGDGWNKKHYTGFAFSVYPELNEYYVNLINKLFNESGTFSKNQYKINNIEVSELLIKLGFRTGFANKELPSWLFEMDQEFKIEFLKGLFDADGTKNDCKYLSLSNYRLIKQVQQLCQQSGVPCSNKILVGKKAEKTTIAKNKKVSETKTGYRIRINFDLISKETNIKEKLLSVTEELSSTNEETTSKVYDIEVESSNHNFICNGVVVHNCMLEDSMLLYRVVRSSERRVFYIDTTGIAPNDIGTYMEQVTEAMKGKDVIDKVTGRGDLRYNPMTVLDDYFIPIRANDKTRIETLAGGTHVSAVEDLEYMQKKLIAGLKVPKAYLTYTEDLSSKAGLAMEDIRFSRTINSLQKIVVSEFNKIAILHLFAKGFEGEDLVDFELRLSNPSTIAIQQKLQTWSTKFDIAAKAKETGLVDTKWIQRELLQLTEEEIMEIKKGKEEDKLEEIKLETMKPPKEVGPQNSPFLSPFDPAQQSTSLNADGVTPPNQVNSQGRPEQVVGPLPSEKEILRIPGSITNPPIKPSMTPNLDNSLRKLSRRKTYSGANATGGVGDINNMVSANNRSFKDFTDKSFFKNPLLEQELINALDIKFIAGLPNDVVSMLSNFEKKTYKERQKIEVIIEKPLHEEIEITIPSTNKQIVKENTNENKQVLLNDVLNILEEE